MTLTSLLELCVLTIENLVSLTTIWAHHALLSPFPLLLCTFSVLPPPPLIVYHPKPQVCHLKCQKFNQKLRPERNMPMSMSPKLIGFVFLQVHRSTKTSISHNFLCNIRNHRILDITSNLKGNNYSFPAKPAKCTTVLG